MRRLPRVGRSIDILRDPLASPSIAPRSCSACRSRRHLLPRAATTNFSSLPCRPARRQNITDPEKPTLTERIRRKLWGTDKPPGQEDPYDQRSRRSRAVTEIVDEEASRRGMTTEGDTYVPASTWDGLEHVGGLAGWWEQNWDPEHAFSPSMWWVIPLPALYRAIPKAKTSTVTYSFTPTERLASPQALTAALHRAVVEVFTLQQAGGLMGNACNISNDFSEDVTAGVQVRVDGQGVVTLDYPDREVRETIVQAAVAGEAIIESPEGVEGELAGSTNPITVEEDLVVEERGSADKESSMVDEKLSQQISTWDTSWLSTPLTDQTLKFHILKRVTHLTGHPISDPLLPTLHTLKDFQAHLLTPPPPPKMADILLGNETLTSLPNVKVYDRRVTPIDKEKAVGRWKVIEKELKEMGLPVTGHA